MNIKAARALLKCQSPHALEHPDGGTRSALKTVAKSPEGQTAIEAQKAADAAVAEKLLIDAPEGLCATFADLSRKIREPKRRHHFSVTEPAFLAVALGFFAMIGVAVWLLLGQLDGFTGMEEAISLAKAGDTSQPAQFEAIDAPVGSLADWFLIQGFDGFAVPAGFTDYRVVGVRVFEFESTPVAQAAVPENRSFFYVFPSKNLGIFPGESGNWKVVEYGEGPDQRVLGISQLGDYCFMITFVGSRNDMEQFIRQSGQ